MRIRELLENKAFKDSDFVTPIEGGRELNYDLAEDLVHFMNNDDQVYRRIVYPKVAICLDSVERKKKVKPSVFRSAVEESYREYVKKFPIRELPDFIDEDVCEQVCDKMYEELRQHIKDGKYKD